jgi:hypothetical protein
MTKIKNGFDKLTDAELRISASTIVTACTNSPYFSGIQADVLEVAQVSNAYSLALAEASTGSKIAIATKNVKREELIAALRSLRDLVTAIAKGDNLILTSSGFPKAKERSGKPPLSKPPLPRVAPGINTGQILVTGVSDRSAVAVVYMMTPDPLNDDSTWTTNFATTRKFTFTRLESGKRYWFKQALIGVRKQYVESDAVSYIAQ